MPNFQKTRGFTLRSGNKPSMSSFKMMGSTKPSPITSPYKQKEVNAEMQAKSAKIDPRYGEMSPEEYKAEVERQVKSKKETGSYNANNTDKVEEPDADVTNVTTTGADKIVAGKSKLGGKIKKGLGQAGKVLFAGFTGGLKEVYGTDAYMPNTVKAYDEDKDKDKDKKTGEDRVDEIINK